MGEFISNILSFIFYVFVAIILVKLLFGFIVVLGMFGTLVMCLFSTPVNTFGFWFLVFLCFCCIILILIFFWILSGFIN